LLQTMGLLRNWRTEVERGKVTKALASSVGKGILKLLISLHI